MGLLVLMGRRVLGELSCEEKRWKLERKYINIYGEERRWHRVKWIVVVLDYRGI